MPDLYVAFYRGSGTAFDWVTRKITRSDFSHCELVVLDRAPEDGACAVCVSSSSRDGGVRDKEITFDTGKWEFVRVDWAPGNAWATAMKEKKKGYDHLALVTSHFFNWRFGWPGRWFCSELCAHALGLDMPHTYAPGDLYRHLLEKERVSNRVLRETHGRRGGGRKRGWL